MHNIFFFSYKFIKDKSKNTLSQKQKNEYEKEDIEWKIIRYIKILRKGQEEIFT